MKFLVKILCETPKEFDDLHQALGHLEAVRSAPQRKPVSPPQKNPQAPAVLPPIPTSSRSPAQRKTSATPHPTRVRPPSAKPRIAPMTPSSKTASAQKRATIVTGIPVTRTQHAPKKNLNSAVGTSDKPLSHNHINDKIPFYLE